MKIFLLVIVLASFLQSAFLPINFVLVLIVARSLVVEDTGNYFLAFFGGLILSFLTQANLGYWPIIFLIVVKLAYMIKKIPVSFNPLIIFISGAILILITDYSGLLFSQQSFSLWIYLTEIILILPIYFISKIWEERFTVKKHTKLRI